MIVLILICIVCGLYVYWNWRPKNQPPMFPGAWPLIGHGHWFIGDSTQTFKALEAKMIVLILIWIVCGLFAYRSWRWNRRPKNEPPMFPGAWPLIGHGPRFIGNSTHLWKTVQDLTNECDGIGGVATLMMGPITGYVVTDPDDALTVASTCLQKDEYYDFGKTWLGDGLATARPTLWKNHRKLLNPAFNQLVLDGFIKTFNKHARKMVTDLAANVDKDYFDQETYTIQYAMETVCATSLEGEFSDNTLLVNQYGEASDNVCKTLVERFQNLLMHSDWMYSWSSLKKEADEYLKIVHNTTDTVLQRKKSEMKGNVTPEKLTGARRVKPFLQLLLELSLDTNVFTDEQLRDHVNTIIVGGRDTLGLASMYTLVLLGSFPHVQDKVYQEIKEVIGESDRDVEKYDLSKLEYLEAVIKESLRLFPSAPIIARYIDKDLKLKNYTLSAGQSCLIFLFALNRHRIWGEDAQEFKPERWLDPVTLPAQPAAFGTFSFGKRNCIGKVYAVMSMKTILVHVLRHYKVKGDWTKLQLKFEIMLKPVSGHHITIERRV